jgi:putative ABC transport system permease protein
VLEQCLYLSLLGFIPGLILSWVAYRVLAEITGLTMVMGPVLAVSVMLTTALMCTISGILAVSKLLAADPAELF